MRLVRTFNRRVHFDERSRGYGVRALVGDKPPRSYTWSCLAWLDQGAEGACTGFSMAHGIAARPLPKRVTTDLAQALYHRARQLDEWPGDDYEGSSVLGAVKAAKEAGHVKEYRWAFGVEDLKLTLGYVGPAVLGINWYEGMQDPDARGVIRVSGEIAGGHAILCNGFNVKTGMFRLHNSWGRDWSVGGECFISEADMARLLKEDGEACIVRK